MKKALAVMFVVIGMLLGALIFSALTPIHDAAVTRIYEASRKH